MRIIVGLLSVAITVLVALWLIMSFDFTRRIAGFGEVRPTGVPGAVSSRGSAN